jgi:uncharacterized protein (TIGR03435 family)
LKHLAICLAAAIVSSALKAQDRPKFEVASIKECKSTDRPPPSTNSPGRLSLSCWPLKRLIQDAYEIFADGKVYPLNPFFPTAPIEGSPDWVNSAKYSIDAKSDTPHTPATMRGPMMQTLLEDRFQLRQHRETREVPVYIMTVARGGPKLLPTREGSCIHVDPSDLSQAQPPPGSRVCAFSTRVRTGTIEVFGVTLDVFAKLLHPGGRPVVNQTGLTGAYDIHLDQAPDPPSSPSDSGASDPSGLSFIAQLRSELGLQLTPGKGPREFLVIDRIARPSSN